jgi:hypothetical protein
MSDNSKEGLKREADEWVKHAKKDAKVLNNFFSSSSVATRTHNLSWEINDSGDKIIISQGDQEQMMISISEATQASLSKKASTVMKTSLFNIKGKDMSKSNHDLRMTVSEARAFSEWFLEHSTNCPYIKEHTETFTHLKFHVTNCSGIGPSLEVTCDCGEKVDITDQASW